MIKPEHNVVGWIEIPVEDMERAITFYETVFDMKLERNKMGPFDMAWFPFMENKSGSGGSLVKHDSYKPSQEGVLIYFTAFSGDLNNEVSRVEKAGGMVLIPRKEISPEYGFMAVVLDTEGNRIAIHSRK